LHWASPANDVNSPDLAACNFRESMFRDISLPQNIYVLKKHASYVERNIALPNDDCFFATSQIWEEVGAAWMSIVPANELAR
jgi:hypothetical protein